MRPPLASTPSLTRSLGTVRRVYTLTCTSDVIGLSCAGTGTMSTERIPTTASTLVPGPTVIGPRPRGPAAPSGRSRYRRFGSSVPAFEEREELLVPVPRLTGAGDLAGSDLQRGEQRRGAVPDVVVGTPLGRPGLQRQDRRGPVQRLDLTLSMGGGPSPHTAPVAKPVPRRGEMTVRDARCTGAPDTAPDLEDRARDDIAHRLAPPSKAPGWQTGNPRAWPAPDQRELTPHHPRPAVASAPGSPPEKSATIG
jgi:hypothetical protein